MSWIWDMWGWLPGSARCWRYLLGHLSAVQHSPSVQGQVCCQDPQALHGLILDSVFLTSAGDRRWELWAVLCRRVILHFKLWIKVVECIWEGCVIITVMWRGLVVSDGLNGLPQCVSAACEVIFWAYDRFAFLMPQDILALAVLRAALSPDLNDSSLVFSSPQTSAVIQGFWLHVWWWSWWLSHHQCTFWCKQSQFQCTPAGLCGCCSWLPL